MESEALLAFKKLYSRMSQEVLRLGLLAVLVGQSAEMVSDFPHLSSVRRFVFHAPCQFLAPFFESLAEACPIVARSVL
jgi:hypothetical protein